MKMRFSEKSLIKFFGNIQPVTESGCHIYCSGTPTSHGGHIVVKFEKRRLMAHRMAWEIAYGDIPSGLFVCHKCDVVSCVNPNHLFLGTMADNMADRNRKGRVATGEHVGTSKLKIEQVREIRRLLSNEVPVKKIAREYGLSPINVSKIRDGKHWKGVP